VPGEVPEPLVPLPAPVAPEPAGEAPDPPPPVLGPPEVPGAVVVLPVPPAPMLLLRLCVLVLSVELDPLVEAPVPDVGVVDWQPAASSAASEKLSKVA
jgi:hypothetical protein